MKILGLITEYNPFHYGHKYHLEESMNITNSTHSIAVMSGSFVQRGEPSLVDKWTKSKMAIDNGVDLVVELPFVYSTQSAELFGYGAVRLLDKTNSVDYLSFGTELGELAPLKELAKIFIEEPKLYKDALKYYLSLGLSFSVSRSKAIEKYLNSYNTTNTYSKTLKGSNNILAIEYLKALYKLDSKIIPIAIKRLGSNYKDIDLQQGFASATGIRHKIFESELHSVRNLLPRESYNALEQYEEKYNYYNRIENYEQIFNYILSTTDADKLKSFHNMETGLENRIIKMGESSNNINTIIKSITTKRYPLTRIQRIFIHLLNKLDENTIKELYKYDPQYIRVLGSNKKGFEILNKIKKNSDINIITKYADYKNLNNNIINKFLSIEEQATNLYFLGLKSDHPIVNKDYVTTSYIK